MTDGFDGKAPSSAPPITCETLDAYLAEAAGRELLPGLWHAVEMHLSGCAACAARLAAEGELERRLRNDAQGEEAPPDLWPRVLQGLASEGAAEAPSSPGLPGAHRGSRRLWPAAAGLAAAAALVLAVALGQPGLWPLGREKTTQAPPAVVTESTNDFLTFRLSGRTPDVVATDFRGLARWLAPRVDFALPHDLTVPAGFRLIGARLCSFLGRRLVSYSFLRGEAAAALYVMPGEGTTLADGLPAAGGASVQGYSAKGLSALVWSEGGLLYALVADFSESELLAFYYALKAAGRAAGGHADPLVIRATELWSAWPPPPRRAA